MVDSADFALHETREEFERLACLLAQEVQDFIDDGVDGGSEMKAPIALLDEFNQAYAKYQRAKQTVWSTEGK